MGRMVKKVGRIRQELRKLSFYWKKNMTRFHAVQWMLYFFVQWVSSPLRGVGGILWMECSSRSWGNLAIGCGRGHHPGTSAEQDLQLSQLGTKTVILVCETQSQIDFLEESPCQMKGLEGL